MNKHISSLVFFAGLSASVSACSSDSDKISNAGGTSSVGAGGGGSTSTAGAATTGGVTSPSTAGASATGGMSSTGGTPEVATGGTLGTGGSSEVATGGAGTGGVSSAVPLTADQACTKVCGVQSTMTCADAYCDSSCAVLYTDKTILAESALYLTMIQCEAQSLTAASDFYCSNGSFFAPPPNGTAPEPVLSITTPTACQAEVCAFTCAEVNYGNGTAYDSNAFVTCGC